MNFCSQCGAGVALIIPEGDNRERHVCGDCSTIHYQNPRIITGTLPVHEDKVLLCKRAIEPRYGLWTLPAGFMENGETTEQGATRETWEEASANIENLTLYTLFNLPYINQVYFFYRANLSDLNFGPGTESLEVGLFSEDEIPWEELAFPVITRTLQLYFDDRNTGHFPVRSEDILRRR
ncbi:NUDIX hydrolase [Simiduia sp. 21SJ11W-1]|uniref:NUDIX hydrolase n=1 Tax=Simiduia sp. 21SJ11W-1 TaxID=2909669 RepID=UPI0020A081E5|nr:NUDIX hydrolase [Simiduia sp. 21SJ11W-1]UTA46321.1 NUDIX hydrolase [Simiduia sp. 21SJ11W-1]